MMRNEPIEGKLSLYRQQVRPLEIFGSQTHISCIAGRFFIVWATREAQEHT